MRVVVEDDTGRIYSNGAAAAEDDALPRAAKEMDMDGALVSTGTRSIYLTHLNTGGQRWQVAVFGPQAEISNRSSTGGYPAAVYHFHFHPCNQPLPDQIRVPKNRGASGQSGVRSTGSGGNRMWIVFAFGPAFFAGGTSILVKCGIRKTDSTIATAIRTIIVLIFSWVMVLAAGLPEADPGDQRAGPLVSCPVGPFHLRLLAVCYYRPCRTVPPVWWCPLTS